MPKQIVTRTLDNGLVVVVEQLPMVRSAAVNLTFPGGCSFEAANQNGVAALLADLMLRGAGGRSSRELSIELDKLGVQYNVSSGWHQATISAATVANRLSDALPLVADILLRPNLEEAQFEMCKIGREQVLRSIEDEPRQKIMSELRKRTYSPPFNRSTEGTLGQLEAITCDQTRAHYETCCTPQGAILSVAGYVEPDEIFRQCEQLFGSWSGTANAFPDELEPQTTGKHITHESTQTHIAIGYPSVPYSHEDYYKAWASVGVLSGGMSSRLFTKVREERGLCYAIGASLSGLKHDARVLCYAGTTNDRAQETLDVTLHELSHLHEGITESELNRCKARGKSSLIMQEESTMGRASTLVRDWFHLGRINTLEEIRSNIESLTIQDVTDYAIRMPAQNFDMLTIGPAPLNQTTE